MCSNVKHEASDVKILGKMANLLVVYVQVVFGIQDLFKNT